MHTTAAIRARGVGRVFGDPSRRGGAVVALEGVDLDVPAGSIHGLVGPNGAGKTTLLGLLLGLARPDTGTLEVVASPVAGFIDAPGLYPALTARANLAATARLRGLPAHEVDEALERVGLTAVADDVVRGFSLGMRQRLGLAAALLGGPRLLVLDEPANGLDPAGSRRVHAVLAELAAHGTAVVISSHRMDELAAVCDEVTLLRAGRVAFTGPLAKLALEGGEIDHRVVVPDSPTARAAALAVAGGTPSLAVVAREPGALVVRGPQAALDALVVGLVGAGVPVRGLAPVVPPLEAAFLALTADDPADDPAQGPAGEDR